MLEPVHTDETVSHAEWTAHLVLFLRVMAALSLLKGLYHWAQVCGIGAGADGGFEAHTAAVADRDDLLRRDRSGRGGRAVAGRCLGRGGVADIGGVDGGGGVVFSAGVSAAASGWC